MMGMLEMGVVHHGVKQQLPCIPLRGNMIPSNVAKHVFHLLQKRGVICGWIWNTDKVQIEERALV